MFERVLGALPFLLLLGAAPSPPVSGAEEARCAALAGADFSNLPDAPTRIAAAAIVKASGEDPAYCKVTGSVAPQVGIEMRLPVTGWNGKSLQVGCGGWCGYVPASACRAALRRGYACIGSDSGHKGSATDVRWAKDNMPGQLDFGFRGVHVAALAGKALAAAYYGSQPRRSYFVGCSTGGYQGVMAAQRFPWDFDGIVAGAPDIDQTQANFRALWFARAKMDAAGKPILGEAQFKLLNDAALAQCDRGDGLKDGIIANFRGCGFKPESLLCGRGGPSDCLSAPQVDAARKIYSGPTDSRGVRTSTGAFLPGSEREWKEMWPTSGLVDFFRIGLPGFTTPEGWADKDFDFDRDHKRLGLAPYYENSNPDLRRFKTTGGKLIIYHGTTDTVDPPMPVIDYYETVERTIGGRRLTQDFARLFMIPGMNHCAGGPGGLDVDWLGALEAWVEHGKAPDAPIGSRAARGDQPAVTRPLYPYPAYARYKGRGDPNKAESFAPAY